MDTTRLGALSIFFSYFAIIIVLFSVIIRCLVKEKAHTTPKLPILLFSCLTIASFLHTWFYMLEFMAWSFTDFESSFKLIPKRSPLIDRVASWLVNTALFEQAWHKVCFGASNWWWSEQLCLYTVGAWTIFLATEGPRKGVKHVWLYMLLGQLVAISVASNLFYVALLVSPTEIKSHAERSQSTRRAPPQLWIPVILSMITVILSPHTSEKKFLPNLLLMHILLVVPLVLPGGAQRRGSTISVRTLYLICAVVSFALRLRSMTNVMSSSGDILDVVKQLWATLYSHPAQSSIGWDIIWTSISFMVWNIYATTQRMERDRATVIVETLSYLFTPLLSVGTVAPYLWSRFEACGARKVKIE